MLKSTVLGPMGGYTANAQGVRFIESDYWSGHMMQEFYQELASGNGPVFLKLNHLAEETVSSIETILHSNERPSRGRFHAGRHTDYRQDMVEMHISEIGLCSGHSASGVWVNERAETTVTGLYAAGDLACVPHNYMLGAFVYGRLAGESAAIFCRDASFTDIDKAQVEAERERIFAPLKRQQGLSPQQIEYKLRRLVNDYLQPPKVAKRMEIGLARFAEIRIDLESMFVSNPHELMRATEVGFILDCAEMAARTSLFRTESRWGLYHYRQDYPKSNDAEWRVHVQVKKNTDGSMGIFKRHLEPYQVNPDKTEQTVYQHLRIQPHSA